MGEDDLIRRMTDPDATARFHIALGYSVEKVSAHLQEKFNLSESSALNKARAAKLQYDDGQVQAEYDQAALDAEHDLTKTNQPGGHT